MFQDKLAPESRMYVNTVLSPPLGGTTVIKHEDALEPIRFTALIELSPDSRYAEEAWVVELWYGSDGQEWQSTAFTEAAEDIASLMAFNTQKVKQKLYTLDLTCQEAVPVQFTLRFKPEPDIPWIWVQEQNGLEDGRILFQSCPETSICFNSLFDTPDKNLKYEPATSQVTGVDVFDVTAPLEPGSGSIIGQPLLIENFYALVKLSSAWMGPRQGGAPFMVDNDALMAGYIRSDGRHVVVLGVSGIGDCTTFIRSATGRIIMKTRNDGTSQQSHRAIIATGLEYQRTVDAAFYRAREMLQVLAEGSPVYEEPSPAPLWNENWYDGLAYCTWNGLGRELSEDRILAALQDLSDSGIYVSTLIIDDNWQSLDNNRRWDKFEANNNFPKGLAHTTSEIRRRFPNIKHIAVWHSLLGYWEGIAPGGYIDSNYKCITVKWHGGHDVRVVDASDIGRVYNDFYKFLSENGVDAVKCDVQASIDEFDSAADRKRLGFVYQDAFKLHSLKYFSRRVIYCMAHIPSILFHSLLPHDAPQALFRNSDDFFPDIPSSHAWHIFANAMNNIFTSHLNGLPDWDMFQSSLADYGSFHAAGRCISGGPIYITDAPGNHNTNIIHQMSALSPRGNTITLRPSCISRPIDPFIQYNKNRLLKIGNFCAGRQGLGDYSLLAVFNVSEAADNSELISLEEFPGIVKDTKYILRKHTTGEVSSIITKTKTKTKGHGAHISITLPKIGWEIFTAVPVKEVTVVRGTLENYSFYFGTVGVMDAMTGASGVLRQEIGVAANRAVISVTLKALGNIGFYISDLPTRTIPQLLITIKDLVIPAACVKLNEKSKYILEVDVERAWRELGFDYGGWSNEFYVLLYI